MQGPANGALKGTRLEGPMHQGGYAVHINGALKGTRLAQAGCKSQRNTHQKIVQVKLNQLLRGAVMAPIKARTHVGVPNRLGTCVVQVGGCTAIAI